MLPNVLTLTHQPGRAGKPAELLVERKLVRPSEMFVEGRPMRSEQRRLVRPVVRKLVKTRLVRLEGRKLVRSVNP